MKKNNSLFIIISLILILALAASVGLVQKSQELRRGAYFAGTKVLFDPKEFAANVGQEFSVPIYVETQPVYGSQEPSKVDFVQARVCWGKEVRIDVPSMDEASVKDALVFGAGVSPAFTEVMYSRMEQPQSGTNYQGCLEFAVRSDLPKDQLKSGMVRVAMIKFKALSAGKGSIVFDTSRTLVSGYNSVDPNNIDQSLKVEEYVNATYTVTGQTRYNRGNCNINTGNFVCTAAADGTYATLAECETSDGCDVAPTPPQASPTLTPTVTVVPGNNLVLNFRYSVVGVRDDSQCAENWPLQVIVLGSGETKMYQNVIGTKEGVVEGRLVYRARVVLEGFRQANNVAVFVKGPKHLQMKYAKADQDSAYDKAGGELTLTSDPNTSSVYDFSRYAMLAGDVTGATFERQDGVVDGRDFSYVKTRAIQRLSCNPGQSLLADLDGNCLVSGTDITTLMLSLAEKQGQLY
jgi:hypothetical protein